MLETLANFIRSNFFIPDARKFWIKPSTRYLSRYLKNNAIDIIISNGTPHSTHLIAYNLKKKFNIPWIADFRDPWTGIGFYHELRLMRWADKKHRKLEKKVLTTADKVVTVSWHWAEQFEKINGQKNHVITNGYDEQDFDIAPISPPKFTIAHLGSFDEDRNPFQLWSALEELLIEDTHLASHLSLDLFGIIDTTILVEIEKFPLLAKKLNEVGFISHDQVLKKLEESYLLLLLINKTPDQLGRIPAKLFEYLATRKKILGIGTTKGDAAKIIRETATGETFEYDDKKSIKEFIKSSFEDYLNKHIVPVGDYQKIQKYSRKNLTKQYAKLIIDTMS